MTDKKVYTAIGLMSGTSLDGEIDVALIRTDGRDFVEVLDYKPYTYEEHVRAAIRPCFGKRERDSVLKKAEDKVTDVHIRAVKASGFQADIIGFHGQTITHDPVTKFTWQIGDGDRLARETGMDVVSDFRSKDIAAGGQGAPFLPLYHQARTGDLEKPIVILNIGGVANVTYINIPPPSREGVRGRVSNAEFTSNNKHPHPNPSLQGGGDIYDILAFDTGPGNALMDDYAALKTGFRFDKNGEMAAQGAARADLVERWLDHPYFYKTPPKSLDRNAWDISRPGDFTQDINALTPEDAMATLLEFTVKSIEIAEERFPAADWYACGGGCHNAALMARLDEALVGGIRTVADLGWNGDALEAEGFAYLAVRSLLGLPLSLPSTTGVPEPMTGGVLHKC